MADGGISVADGGISVVPTPRRVEGKYKAILVCWFLGIGSVVSWNSMVTIGDYYYEVFQKYHPARVLPVVYQLFALGTVGILAYHEAKFNSRKQNLLGYILLSSSTFGLLVIDLATSGKGGIGNYIGICVLVAAFGVANALVQGGIVGELSFMCPVFMQSFNAGVAAAGTLTSVLRLVTKAAFAKSAHGLRKGAILFLTISIFFEFLCIFVYAFVFAKLPIVKHFRKKAASEGCKTVSADLAAAGIQTTEETVNDEYERLSKKQLVVQNIDYALDLYFIYVVTLSIFPGFLFENTGKHQLGSWYAVVLVAVFHVWDLIARYIPLIECIRLESRKGHMIASSLQFLFIPCFYFTAKYGDQGWMIMLSSFLGLTNGYLTVCVFIVAPRGYKAPEQNALGNLLVVFLIAGIFSGVALDWLWIIGKGEF